MPVAAIVCVGTGLIEEFGASAFQSTLGLILIAVALGLGSIGAIHEFGDKTAQFLFTKPRSRAYFVWASWAVGAFELLAVALVNLLAGWLTLSRYSRNPFHSALVGSVTPGQFAGTVILSLYVYSLTYSLTAVLRNGLKGLGASMGIVFGLPFLAIAVRWRWHMNLPIPTSPIGSLSLLASNIIWIFITLLFVFVSQMIIEKAEV
jgi:ABC-type transport system involved in multi-copper enzyme maturation permease subunit